MCLCSCVRLSATPWPAAHRLLCPGDFPDESRLPFPPPGDLLKPGIKPGSLALQAESLLLSRQGSPHIKCTTGFVFFLNSHFYQGPTNVGRDLTKTMKKAAPGHYQEVYTSLGSNFHANKRVGQEIALILAGSSATRSKVVLHI